MPMYTPTTSRVRATETTPPMFRPCNQENLVPTDPLNPSPSQSFMPGLGAVRSGNLPGGNGLDPSGEEQLAAWRRTQVAQAQIASGSAKEEAKILMRELAKIRARLQSSSATGIPLPRAEILQLKMEENRLLRRLEMLSPKTRKVQSGGAVLPPWKRIPMIDAPVTPDVMKYASPGISTQQGRAQILAMQKNIQPVRPMNGVGEFPAKEVAVGAGLLGIIGVLYYLNKKRG